MKRYEYIRIELDMGNLKELNSLSGSGWRVAAVVHQFKADYALLERPLPAQWMNEPHLRPRGAA